MKAMPNLDTILQSWEITEKDLNSQKLIFRSNVWRSEQEHKNSLPKYGCFATVGLEKTYETSVLSMEFKLVKHEGNHLWLFSKGLMLNMKSQYIGHLRLRTKSLGRNWCWERFSARGEGNGRRRDGCKVSLTQSVTDSKVMVWKSSERFEGQVNPGFLVYTDSQESGKTEQHQKN